MRRAFTIVELVVVMAVLGLVIAITLPAVQSAREASRRSTCTANVHELGRALHVYQSALRSFPPAMPAMPQNPKIGNAWYSPHVALLPYLEQDAAFRNVNLATPVVAAISKNSPPVSGSGSPLDARQTIIPIFKCPSDSMAHAAGPVVNYRVCTGAEPRDWSRGTFVILHPRPSGDFLDGLTATMAMSEKLIGAATPATFSWRRDFWYSGAAALQWNPSADEMIQICGSLVTPPADYYSFAGSSWFYAGYEFTWYNHVATPNTAVADCATALGHPPDGKSATPVTVGLFQASSGHPIGVNCLLMDGSCRFYRNETDAQVWRALATVAAGEAFADDRAF